MADVGVLKTLEGNLVRVRLPPSAPEFLGFDRAYDPRP